MLVSMDCFTHVMSQLLKITKAHFLLVSFCFQRGDIVRVLATNVYGMWEGEVNGRRGTFPFTHVEFIREDESHPT